jgi:hypothetical protein
MGQMLQCIIDRPDRIYPRTLVLRYICQDARIRGGDWGRTHCLGRTACTTIRLSTLLEIRHPWVRPKKCLCRAKSVMMPINYLRCTSTTAGYFAGDLVLSFVIERTLQAEEDAC